MYGFLSVVFVRASTPEDSPCSLGDNSAMDKCIMLDSSCISCRGAKAVLTCGVCLESVCKKCGRFLEESTFSFLPELPEALAHTYYCPACHIALVEPALESYNEVMERAKTLYFFFNTQRRTIPVIKCSKKNIHVEGCDDRDETILRLGFLAAEQGYNAVIQAEVVSKKLRNAGYQKSVWQGVATPAQVSAERMDRISD